MSNTFINQLMTREPFKINNSFFQLPEETDFTQSKMAINYDPEKQSSYVFYVENPVTEKIGYHDNLGVFVVKATPYIVGVHKDFELSKTLDDMNAFDGDTISFDIETLQDTNTRFTLGNKTFQSLTEALVEQNQDYLITRLIGIDAPEVPHYGKLAIPTKDLNDYLLYRSFEQLKTSQEYHLQRYDHKDSDKIECLFYNGVFCEVISKHSLKDDFTLCHVVLYHDAHNKPAEYYQEALEVKALLRSTLQVATDIRIVLDAQSYSRKPSAYYEPYSKVYNLDESGLLKSQYLLSAALWEQFGKIFPEYPDYKYKGYNMPGQDNYGRQLGAVYVKLVLPELGKDDKGQPKSAWVNLAKYLLYHYSTFTIANPNYSSNPLENYHQNFFSPIFKLNSYDKNKIEVLDRYLSQTNDLIYQRNILFEQLTKIPLAYMKEHTVILGDMVLQVPPETIRMVNQVNNKKIPLLRSKGSAKQTLPNSQRLLEMDIYFSGPEGINGQPCPLLLPSGEQITYYMNGLRSLIAMFKLTPFLPIENNYINEQLDINAVTLVNLQVETLVKYPACLKATLTLAEFNYAIYMPDLPESEDENTFARAIHFPAMRWYYQRPLIKGQEISQMAFNSPDYIENSYGDSIALVPMSFKDSTAKFYVPDALQLLRRLEIMSDPKPIVAQEMITPDFKDAIIQFKNIYQKLIKLTSQPEIISAINHMHTPEENFLMPEAIFSSSNIGEQPTESTFTTLFPIYMVSNSSNTLTEELYPNFSQRYFKKLPLQFLDSPISDKLSCQPIHFSTLPNREEILKVAYDAVNNATSAIQNYLSSFGSVEIYQTFDTISDMSANSKWHIRIPLPSEISQNIHQFEMLAKQFLTAHAKDNPSIESLNIFSYNHQGHLSLEICYNFKLENLSNGTDEPVFRCSSIFQLEHNNLGYQFVEYLCQIVDDEGNFEGDYNYATQEELYKERKDIVNNDSNVLKFNEYPCGEILIEQIAVSYANTFSNMHLKMLDGSAFQYCGGQDMMIQLSVTTDDLYTLSSLSMLPEISAYYARTYRKVLNSWPLRLECEFTQMFGIHEVIIENVQTQTVPNHPGLTRVVITMSSLDRTVRRKEALKKLDVDNNFSLMHPEVSSDKQAKTFFDLQETLSTAELYPDLQLPTFNELEEAGFTIYNQFLEQQSNKQFVDPDFYFIYGHVLASEIFQKNFMEAFEKLSFSYDITDTFGAWTRLTLENEKFSLKPNNSISSLQQNAFNELSSTYNYRDLSTEIINSSTHSAKSQLRLAETLGTLDTPCWHICNDAKLFFRESDYLSYPTSTLERIQQQEEATLTAINRFLDKDISLIAPNATSNTIQNKAFGNFEDFDQWVDDVLIMCVEEIQLIHPEIFSTILSFSASSETSTAKTSKILKDILLAYADAISGTDFFGTSKVLIHDDENNDTYLKRGWKMNMITQISNKEDENGKLTHIPFCLVSDSNDSAKRYAASMQDAIDNGYSFGAFGIRLHKGKEIKHLRANATNEDYYFIDSYYQADDKKHRELLLSSPAYAMIALLREIFILYKYFIENKKMISIYELFRSDWINESPNSSPEIRYEDTYTSPVLNNLDDIEKSIFESFYEMLTALVNIQIEDMAVRETIIYKEMNLNKDEDHPVAIAFLKKKKTTSATFDELVKKYEEKITSLEKDEKINQEAIDRYTYLKNTALNYENTDARSFCYDVLDLYVYYNLKKTMNQDLADEVAHNLMNDEYKIILGKLIGFSCMLLDSKTIMDFIRKEDFASLNHLSQIIKEPTFSQQYSYLRKFMYALEGREVLKIDQSSSTPQTYESIISNYLFEKVSIERSINPKKYLKDSFLDMIHYDKRGRMLRAFPTYYMMFIDEGREVGYWKLHDNFYSCSAIAELEVTNSRKIATTTTRVVLSNLFNSYTNEDKDLVSVLDNVEYKNFSQTMEETFYNIFSPRAYAIEKEYERQISVAPLSTKLKAGTRIHIRMGYGSNAADLPIVFNGNIAEVKTGEVVEFIAQGDGRELLNPIQEYDDVADIENNESFILARLFQNWLTNGATPKEILCTLLTSEGKWLDKELYLKFRGSFGSINPFGITHFGDKYFNSIFNHGEPVQNIFEVYARAPYQTDGTNNVGLEQQYRTEDVPRISLHALGLTVWDISHICASTAPDYKCSIVPFGLRSSLFLGSGRHYFAYDYISKIDEATGNTFIIEKRKPFEQYHYITSFTDIIENNIHVDTTTIKTNAVGLYTETGWFGNERAQQTERLYVDHDIYPEFQKAATVDTQLWAQGLPVLGNMFGFTSDISKSVGNPLPGAKEIAWRMTASSLKNTMKDMYQGEIIIMGNPVIKPYDRLCIQDTYEEMQGTVWVESVVHSFNATTGFTSSVFVDCINVIDDRYERENDFMTRSAMMTAAAAYAPGVLLNRLVFNKGLKLTKNTVGKLLLNAGRAIDDSTLIEKVKNLFAMFGKEFTTSEATSIAKSIRATNAITHVEPINYAKNAIKAFKNKSDYMVYLSEETGEKLHTKRMLKDIFKNEYQDFYYTNILQEIEKGIASIKDEADPKDILKLIELMQKDGKALDCKAIGEVANLAYEKDELFINLADDVLDDFANNTIDLLRNLSDEIRVNYTLTEEFKDAIISLVEHVATTGGDVGIDGDVFENLMNYAVNSKRFQTGEDIMDFASDLKKYVSVCTDKDVYDRLSDIAHITRKLDNAKSIMSKIKDVKGLKTVCMAIGGMGGPIGLISAILWTVVEVVFSTVIGGYATEWAERYLQNLQVMQIYPLTKSGVVMVGGIDGHKGLVIGSPTEDMQGEWTRFITDLFGNKTYDNFLIDFMQTFFISERTKAIAAHYRSKNHIPDPLASNFDREKMITKLLGEVNKKTYSKASSNELFLMNVARYETLEEGAEHLKDYMAGFSTITNSFTTSTLENFYYILSDPTIKRYYDMNLIGLFHEIKADTHLKFTKHGVSEEIPVFIEENNYHNVPILRQEALVALKLITDKYIETVGLLKEEVKETSALLNYQFMITSCTIPNEESYDGTGLTFRVEAQYYTQFLEAANDVATELKGGTNQLFITEIGNTYKEIIITVGIPKQER